MLQCQYSRRGVGGGDVSRHQQCPISGIHRLSPPLVADPIPRRHGMRVWPGSHLWVETMKTDVAKKSFVKFNLRHGVLKETHTILNIIRNLLIEVGLYLKQYWISIQQQKKIQ